MGCVLLVVRQLPVLAQLLWADTALLLVIVLHRLATANHWDYLFEEMESSCTLLLAGFIYMKDYMDSGFATNMECHLNLAS